MTSSSSPGLPLFQPIAVPDEPDAIPLNADAVRRDMRAPSWFSLTGKATVRNVDQATLTPVLPSGPGTGAAVVFPRRCGTGDVHRGTEATVPR